MSGRGAKGSIKDRLISMLYRLRYSEKKLKEEEYTKVNKENKLSYIQNLQNFKEKENINLLEKKDKYILSKVNVNAKVKFNNGVGIEKQSKNVENFNDNNFFNVETIDLKIDDMSKKNSEILGPVNLKKEIKKTKSEIVILSEVKKIVNTTLDELNEIKIEAEKIKSLSKNKNQDFKELEKRYIILKEKIKKLKEKYDKINARYDLSDFAILPSIKLMNNIENYKTIANLNELEMMVNVCKKEINKLNSVDKINEKNKTTGVIITNQKKEQSISKNNYLNAKEKIENLKFFENNVKKEIETQKKLTDDLYEKASYLEKELLRETKYIYKCNMLNSIFKLATGVFTLPLTGLNLFGISLGANLINKGLKQINNGIEKKEYIKINYKYEDISDKINNVKDKIEYTNFIIEDSLNELNILKSKFKNEYSEISKILPDYDKALNKIDNLENLLKNQQNKILGINNKLEEEKKLNNKKLQKVINNK